MSTNYMLKINAASTYYEKIICVWLLTSWKLLKKKLNSI